MHDEDATLTAHVRMTPIRVACGHQSRSTAADVIITYAYARAGHGGSSSDWERARMRKLYIQS